MIEAITPFLNVNSELFDEVGLSDPCPVPCLSDPCPVPCLSDRRTPLVRTTLSDLTTLPIFYAICMRNHRIIIGNVVCPVPCLVCACPLSHVYLHTTHAITATQTLTQTHSLTHTERVSCDATSNASRMRSQVWIGLSNIDVTGKLVEDTLTWIDNGKNWSAGEAAALASNTLPPPCHHLATTLPPPCQHLSTSICMAPL